MLKQFLLKIGRFKAAVNNAKSAVILEAKNRKMILYLFPSRRNRPLDRRKTVPMKAKEDQKESSEEEWDPKMRGTVTRARGGESECWGSCCVCHKGRECV